VVGLPYNHPHLRNESYLSVSHFFRRKESYSETKYFLTFNTYRYFANVILPAKTAMISVNFFCLSFIHLVSGFNGIALGIFPFATTYSVATFAGSFFHSFHLVLLTKFNNFRIKSPRHSHKRGLLLHRLALFLSPIKIMPLNYLSPLFLSNSI
jgi:hypothetical protein